MDSPIYVRMADMKYGYAPARFKTVLGSCVGIVLFNPQKKFGAIAHVMLPKNQDNDKNICKYADTAIEKLMAVLSENRLLVEYTYAKLVGGAKIYFSSDSSIVPDIGNENIIICRKLLMNKGISIIAEDILGSFGRTMIFDVNTGKINIRRFDGCIIEI